MAKVSVIVPAYNVEDYIQNCLQSLISQTLTDIEIIIIDDGSTDKTKEIISEFAQNDLRINLITQQNQGVSAARNAGMRIATGEYIGFVDSDDWIDPDFYEKLYEAAKRHDADVSVASILKHKKNYQKYNVHYNNSKCANTIQEKIKISENKNRRFFYVWNRIYRTSLIRNNNLTFPEGRLLEDIKFSMHAIYYANRIVSVPKVKYHYVERSNSIIKSKDKTGKKRNDHIIAYVELQEFAKKHNIKLPERLNYVGSHWQSLFIKVYEGQYKTKYLLFGILPIFAKTTK